MELKLNVKSIGKALVLLWGGIVAVFIAYLLYTQVALAREEVQLVPWKPNETSSHVCYVVLKGPRHAIAIACLEERDVEEEVGE